MAKLHKEHIRLSYINTNCANDTYVKTRQKRMAVVIFRDTMQRTVFTKTTKVLCLVSCVLYYDTHNLRSGEFFFFFFFFLAGYDTETFEGMISLKKKNCILPGWF